MAPVAAQQRFGGCRSTALSARATERIKKGKQLVSVQRAARSFQFIHGGSMCIILLLTEKREWERRICFSESLQNFRWKVVFKYLVCTQYYLQVVVKSVLTDQVVKQKMSTVLNANKERKHYLKNKSQNMWGANKELFAVPRLRAIFIPCTRFLWLQKKKEKESHGWMTQSCGSLIFCPDDKTRRGWNTWRWRCGHHVICFWLTFCF